MKKVTTIGLVIAVLTIIGVLVFQSATYAMMPQKVKCEIITSHKKRQAAMHSYLVDGATKCGTVENFKCADFWTHVKLHEQLIKKIESVLEETCGKNI